MRPFIITEMIDNKRRNDINIYPVDELSTEKPSHGRRVCDGNT